MRRMLECGPCPGGVSLLSNSHCLVMRLMLSLGRQPHFFQALPASRARYERLGPGFGRRSDSGRHLASRHRNRDE